MCEREKNIYIKSSYIMLGGILQWFKCVGGEPHNSFSKKPHSFSRGWYEAT